MIRKSVQLGSTPFVRRVIAAFILFGAAIVFAVSRSSGTQLWIELGVNLVGATAALVFLHFRWRSREKRMMSPKKARDIFS